MTTIAITGSTGFIGKYIADKLPFSQKRLTRSLPSADTDKIHWIKGDLREPHAVDQFIENADILLHLAWQGSPRYNLDAFQQNYDDVLIPTLRLFETFAKRCPGGQILFASTGGNMYGMEPKSISFLESDVPQPLSLYSLLKLEAENFLKELVKKHPIGATIMRISNPYGTLLPMNRGQGLIGIAFSKLLANEPLILFDPLDLERDYIHLEDLSQAILKIIEHPSNLNDARTFNISSGKGYSNHQVLQLIESVSSSKLLISRKIANETDATSPKKSILSNKKIFEELLWAPSFDLRSGLNFMWRSIKGI